MLVTLLLILLSTHTMKSLVFPTNKHTYTHSIYCRQSRSQTPLQSILGLCFEVKYDSQVLLFYSFLNLGHISVKNGEINEFYRPKNVAYLPTIFVVKTKLSFAQFFGVHII